RIGAESENTAGGQGKEGVLKGNTWPRDIKSLKYEKKATIHKQLVVVNAMEFTSSSGSMSQVVFESNILREIKTIFQILQSD
ncbi:1256_t:CDS:2, partial [Gigaspora rosea]